MIGRIVMTRVEPCFWGNKPVTGEASKVKKDAQNLNKQQPLNQNGVDTFTASESTKKTNKNEKSARKNI